MKLLARALPRSWVASFDQLQRDVSVVARGLRGEHPSPIVPRGRAAEYVTVEAPRASELLAPRTLRVARVVRETADAVSVTLEDPAGGALAFRPGQFFTLLLTIDGEQVRRAYSVASDCRDTSRVTIAVKRVSGGLVSNHVNDAFVEGQSVQVLGPSGTFGLEPSATAERHVVLLAGGSGITPMMAIARAVLALEPRSRVTLVYGNRGEADIIFNDALAALAAEHADRFTLRHVLQSPPAAWTGGRGLLDRPTVHAELDRLAIDWTNAEAYLCGPDAMMSEARAALVERGVPADRIKEERFATPHLRVARPQDEASAPQILTLKRGRGEERSLTVAPSQTILEAGLAAGVAMPYSCAMGGCAACKVKLCDGDVEMEEPNCLTADERAGGYVLACVSRLKKASTIELPDAADGASREVA